MSRDSRCCPQADLYAGALFITESTGFEGDGPIYISILILLAIATLFTVAGGLAAVIWTDFIQTVLMIIGAIVLSALGGSQVELQTISFNLNNYTGRPLLGPSPCL